jgi:hypothetical protein
MARKRLILIRGLALAALVLSLSGCGKRQYDVTGQVKYNGAALAKPNGQIVFLGPDGTQAVATIGADGTYTASKVSAGLNRIVVYYPNPSFTKPARPKGEPDPKYRPPTTSPYLTPEKYASVDTSQLSIEVAQGTVFNVDLTGPPIP